MAHVIPLDNGIEPARTQRSTRNSKMASCSGGLKRMILAPRILDPTCLTGVRAILIEAVLSTLRKAVCYCSSVIVLPISPSLNTRFYRAYKAVACFGNRSLVADVEGRSQHG